ncbi:hypothetical protein M5K25_011871 [Dendrobium thyrsiflorum]|uniref:Uncharacterized protein n=1 Tax=Dendrobium thyrsiflorum TaxID=117978 RepID=A0ABD0VBG1_DENTH
MSHNALTFNFSSYFSHRIRESNSIIQSLKLHDILLLIPPRYSQWAKAVTAITRSPKIICIGIWRHFENRYGLRKFAPQLYCESLDGYWDVSSEDDASSGVVDFKEVVRDKMSSNLVQRLQDRDARVRVFTPPSSLDPLSPFKPIITYHFSCSIANSIYVNALRFAMKALIAKHIQRHSYKDAKAAMTSCLNECDDLISDMFHHFLNIMRPKHSNNAFSMETIMALVIEDSKIFQQGFFHRHHETFMQNEMNDPSETHADDSKATCTIKLQQEYLNKIIISKTMRKKHTCKTWHQRISVTGDYTLKKGGVLTKKRRGSHDEISMGKTVDKNISICSLEKTLNNKEKKRKLWRDLTGKVINKTSGI